MQLPSAATKAFHLTLAVKPISSAVVVSKTRSCISQPNVPTGPPAEGQDPKAISVLQGKKVLNHGGKTPADHSPESTELPASALIPFKADAAAGQTGLTMQMGQTLVLQSSNMS